MAQVYKLKKPVTFEGKEYTELNLDFDSLTGRDLINAERQYVRSAQGNELANLKEIMKEMQVYIAAFAAKCPPELILSLGIKDVAEITRLVQVFILGDE
ncbi:phage tail assembly protein [Paenibacillus melissococcoides]|uniref:Phage tail assembly protein n=1 Tax=Paenibacillus melissococcoides TaxID=2912268 RepID=A0ABM9G766_9BACL|nr:phage tail assembly protein [Paenibacillus melissococcoides]CAH8247458.1 phage tail assembly protein [Paenibacillus melissococcoides]CAH8705084.1 phage tail assembly protein [Paenibacillus melissococcoides]CAH8708310.1 phage tail assembly protein [Paenibacillus melissococcoides]